MFNIFKHKKDTEKLPLNVMASHYLYESFLKHNNIDKAKQYARNQLARLLYKEFPDLTFEVVAKSDSHVYYRLPEELQQVFQALSNSIDAEAQLLVELNRLKNDYK